MKVNDNGRGGMDAVISVRELTKIVSAVVIAVTLVIAVMSFMQLGPTGTRTEEQRMTRIESSIEALDESVRTLTELLADMRAKELADLRGTKPTDYRTRVEYIETFLIRKFPQEFKK
jgi:hypothetical protein